MASFDVRDIRRGMDVYGRDGRWLGSVLRVDVSAETPPPDDRATYPLRTERFDGEQIGPAPTQAAGNRGPSIQTRDTRYLGGRPAHAPVGRVLIGRWHGLVGRRWIDTDRVVNVSLERVVVDTDAVLE